LAEIDDAIEARDTVEARDWLEASEARDDVRDGFAGNGGFSERE